MEMAVVCGLPMIGVMILSRITCLYVHKHRHDRHDKMKLKLGYLPREDPSDTRVPVYWLHGEVHAPERLAAYAKASFQLSV